MLGTHFLIYKYILAGFHVDINYFLEYSFRFFGHFSHRSEWQLIKIDYKGLFSRKCMDGDYQTWYLHNKVTEILFNVHTHSLKNFLLMKMLEKNQNTFFFMQKRESCAWWVRSRFIWSAGLATVACWLKIIPGSTPQSHASAQPMILNGDEFLLCTSLIVPKRDYKYTFLITCFPKSSSTQRI